VDLVVDLPKVDGGTRPVRLQLTVASCHLDRKPTQGWRIGGTVVPVGEQDREALVEYCHVVAARSRLTESGRLLARMEKPASDPAAATARTGGRPHLNRASQNHSVNT
jgi:hypothetical protein